MQTQPQGLRTSVLVLEFFRIVQGLGEPAFDFGDHAVYAAVELDAGPAEAGGVEALFFEAVSEVVVVGLLAAVLQQQAEPHRGAGEVAEDGTGVDGFGGAGGDATALGVGQGDEAGYAALRGVAFVQAVGYAA